MFHGFDYRPALSGTAQGRLGVMAGAIEWVLTMQQEDAARETIGRSEETRTAAL